MILWLWFLLARFLLLDTDDPADDDEGDAPPDDADETKNPKRRIKSLLEANTRLARKVKEKDQWIAELEQSRNQDGQRSLRPPLLQSYFALLGG